MEGQGSGRSGVDGSRAARLGRRWRGLSGWQQGLAVLALGVAGLVLMLVLRPSPAEVEPPRQVPTVTTVEVRAEEGPIRVRGSGTVRPSAEVTVASQVGGRVSWVSPSYVSGGRVGRGEPLFRIDPADFENAVEAAEAEVAQRRVGVMEAEEEVALAREEWARIARREGLDPDPDSASALVLRQPQLQAARAALQSAEARLEDATLALERTWVRAPFDGVVRDESVDLGQFVAAGQGAGRLYATEAVEVVVPMSDGQAALIGGLWGARAGDERTRIPARVEAAFGGRRFSWDAYVDRAETALDEETRTVDVVLRVPNAFGEDPEQPDRPPLLLGTFARADIEGRAFERYFVIPATALRDDGTVWLVRSDTLLAMAPVELIQRVEDSAFVHGALEEGDPVIVSQLPWVTDGMTVRVAEPLETGGVAGTDGGAAGTDGRPAGSDR